MQGDTITSQPADVARIAIPLLLCFTLMWGGSYALGRVIGLPYDRTATLAFTAAGNNFELAIAVAIATFGVTSGQGGLVAGFYLRRAGPDFVILDAQDEPDGAWRHLWPSLRLFSPAQYGSLPGRPMPPTDGCPDAAHVIDYLTAYEERCEPPIRRPVHVEAVHRRADGLRVDTGHGSWTARRVISVTGTWWQPYLPYYPGRDAFRGRRLHTTGYGGPKGFRGRRVVIVGGGNSAAQVVADLSADPRIETFWVTLRPPRLLPDDVAGRALFEIATRRRAAILAGTGDDGGGRILMTGTRADTEPRLHLIGSGINARDAAGPGCSSDSATTASAFTSVVIKYHSLIRSYTENRQSCLMAAV